VSGPNALSRQTEAYPVVQRTSIRFFRRVTRFWIGLFRDIGLRALFMRDIARALGDPATYVPETIRQMKAIGVDSVPLTIIVAAFIGGVIALLTRYQLLPGVQLSIIGLATRLMGESVDA
jgi:ABC-type transporter Mla maintaining outer membrane lipid asymmetry permease subunit MlaE